MQGINHDTVRVDADTLQSFCETVLVRQGLPSSDATQVARHLVMTNLRGTDSHGIARLPHYVRRLRAGSIRSRPDIRFERLGASIGRVDGGHGLGQLVMQRATEEASALARESGSGWVNVVNSSHCGALAPFGLWLADRDLIGIVLSHVDPMVLPFGAAAPFCGTNPICITAPGTEGRHLCLDMATSIAPWNVVANAAAEGVPIPQGWAVDESGRPTTDPGQVHALHAFGAHRGSGLGIMIDVLCSLLGGGPYGPDIPKMYGDLGQQRRLGGIVGAIHIAGFLPPDVFRTRATELMNRLGRLPPAEGNDRVRFPGEPELEITASRSRDGIPIGVGVLRELNDLARDCGMPLLQPRPVVQRLGTKD